MTDTLLKSIDDRGVCILTLNRADKHNALNSELIATLTTELESIAQDPALRVVVLTGTGNSFSSGADLEWMRASIDFDQLTNQQDALQLSALMRTLSDLPLPTIARVNGPAFGGGVGLIACCDIAIAAEDALFAFSEVRLGLVPAVISPYILMAIGPRHAGRLFMTAERFSARQAREMQLLHKVVPGDDLNQCIEQEIELLLKAGPNALKACKQLIPRLNNDQVDLELAALIAALRTSDEGQEGLRAFLEKRKPQWE